MTNCLSQMYLLLYQLCRVPKTFSFHKIQEEYLHKSYYIHMCVFYFVDVFNSFSSFTLNIEPTNTFNSFHLHNNIFLSLLLNDINHKIIYCCSFSNCLMCFLTRISRQIKHKLHYFFLMDTSLIMIEE